MSKHYYTNEKNAQIILAILKAYGIKTIVASPGTTNMAVVASMQQDSFFEVFSSVDERSAAYLACGIATETGKPVVLSCTGATASRNYLPGLTEAYYRKLPILAITSMQSFSNVGHLIAQTIDRSIMPIDAIKYSVELPIVKDEDDLWACEVKVNKAVSELFRHGGGPVHINLPTSYDLLYQTKELPNYRVIKRITQNCKSPELPKCRIGIFVGAHMTMSITLTEAIDQFCSTNNAVVFCDHTSGYKGKYKVLGSLLTSQRGLDLSSNYPDLLIHIGEVTGDYYSLKLAHKNVWRVSEDGEIRDTFKKLQYVFEMPEEIFFKKYISDNSIFSDSYFELWQNQNKTFSDLISDLPFSNIWVASKMAPHIPANSTMQFAILNSLRSWNFFKLPATVNTFSNVGGFGIDGNLSSLIGASFTDQKRLFYSIIGDLSLFYDLNVLGNRHLGSNIRIILINNGKGVEFRNFNHPAAQFGEDANQFIAASGHFGNKSRTLLKHFVSDLGFQYISANNKDEFIQVYDQILSPIITEKPIFFEIFTDSNDDSSALEIITDLQQNIKEDDLKAKIQNSAKQILGEKGISVFKKVFKNSKD